MRDEQEMIAKIEPTEEERTIDNMDFVDLYEELETLIERKLREEIAKKKISKLL
jgi:hypothetical protein